MFNSTGGICMCKRYDSLTLLLPSYHKVVLAEQERQLLFIVVWNWACLSVRRRVKYGACTLWNPAWHLKHKRLSVPTETW